MNYPTWRFIARMGDLSFGTDLFWRLVPLSLGLHIFNKLSKIANCKNIRALLFACGEASSIHLPDFSESQVNK